MRVDGLQRRLTGARPSQLLVVVRAVRVRQPALMHDSLRDAAWGGQPRQCEAGSTVQAIVRTCSKVASQKWLCGWGVRRACARQLVLLFMTVAVCQV